MPQVLSDGEVATAAAFGGWTPNSPDLVTAVAVSFAENRDSDPKATHKNANGTVDYGLWQVNSVHNYPVDQLLTTTGNARAAFEVWKQSGWSAWTTYKTGAYLLFVPRARNAVAHGSAEGGPAGTGTGTAPTLTALDVAVKAVSGVAGWFGNKHNWVRIAETAIGGALVVGGLVAVATTSKTSKAVKGFLP